MWIHGRVQKTEKQEEQRLDNEALVALRVKLPNGVTYTRYKTVTEEEHLPWIPLRSPKRGGAQ